MGGERDVASNVATGGSYGTQNAWDHGGRLGESHRLRSSPPRTPAKSERPPRQVGDGSAALLRHEQCALPDLDAYRHLGAGQGQPLHAAAAERRAYPVGFWIRCQTPSAELPVARWTVATGNFDVAGRDGAADATRLARREEEAQRALN